MAERSACVLAAHRLREAVLRERCLYMPVSFPLKFDGGLREALRACLPRELSSGGSCHSKVKRALPQGEAKFPCHGTVRPHA